jgi:hypothetical protein
MTDRGRAPDGTEWTAALDAEVTLAAQLDRLAADRRQVKAVRPDEAAASPPSPAPAGPPPNRATERDAAKQRALDGVTAAQRNRGG